VDGKTVKEINFFEPGDSALLHALQNPRVNIAGIRRPDLLPALDMFSPSRLSRQLRRLLDPGLRSGQAIGVIKRVAAPGHTGIISRRRGVQQPQRRDD
jgi:hypothetical protein